MNSFNDECLIRQRVHYWSLKRKTIIIRSTIHRRFRAHYRSGGYQQDFRTSRILFFFFLSELDLSSCFRLIKFVLHVLKYIASQIEVCAFRESRVFICISSHNPQISRKYSTTCWSSVEFRFPHSNPNRDSARSRAVLTASWSTIKEVLKGVL